jgi:ketosteroid isomerase-like protein
MFDDSEKLQVSKGHIGLIALAFLVVAGLGVAFWTKSHQKPVVVDTAGAVDAVRAADAKWARAAAAHDLEGTLAFYADDAVAMPPNSAIAMDRGAQRKAWAAILAPGTEVTWTAGKVEAANSGELVYDVGIYTVITKGKKGKQSTDGGKYLSVWKKQADGSWKAVANTWNSDKALPGTVNAGG